MNLVRCSRCGKKMIAEEFANHKCDIPIKDVKSIQIEDYTLFDDLDEDDNVVMHLMGS